jgi:hypothetical protein
MEMGDGAHSDDCHEADIRTGKPPGETIRICLHELKISPLEFEDY